MTKVYGTPILKATLDAVKKQMLDQMQEELMKQMLHGILPQPVGITSSARMDVFRPPETNTVRIGLEVSMRELMSDRTAQDIVADAKAKLSSHLVHFLERELHMHLDSASVDIEKMVKDALRDEIKRQVRETVEARIEDFLEEAL